MLGLQPPENHRSTSAVVKICCKVMLKSDLRIIHFIEGYGIE